MASVRNITEHTLDLRCIGRAVEPQELVEVPDDVFNVYEWPDTVWETDEPKRAKKSTAKKES